MTSRQFSSQQSQGPNIERVRHNPQPCELEVEHVHYLTPSMVRVVLVGEPLADFESLAFDDHTKIFIPVFSGGFVSRHYTLRRFERPARTLTIDFAVHDAGPATRWALNARPGNRLRVRGPKSSKIISPSVHRWFLIGDETALPAIGRFIEEAGPGTQITCAVAVSGAHEYQQFNTEAELAMHWIQRPLSNGSNPAAFLNTIHTLEVQPGTLVWVATEASVAHAVRAYLLERKGCDKEWLKIHGYWIAGKANGHEKFG